MKLGTNDIGSVYLGTNAVSSVYLGTNLVWSGMDADYKAILDYATTQGYTLPSASQRLLQEQLVIDLKAAGIWSKLDTFAVFATDGDSDFALIDWIRLSQYTAVNSPTFTTDIGFTGNGTSAYIDTNFNISTNSVNYLQDSASRFGYINGTPPDTNAFDGLSNRGSYNTTKLNSGSSNKWRVNQGSNANGSGVVRDTDYLLHLYRDGSASSGFYKNTTLEATSTISSAGLNSATQIIMAGLTAWGFSGMTISLYGMGGDLSAENTDLYNAVNTYITSI